MIVEYAKAAIGVAGLALGLILGQCSEARGDPIVVPGLFTQVLNPNTDPIELRLEWKLEAWHEQTHYRPVIPGGESRWVWWSLPITPKAIRALACTPGTNECNQTPSNEGSL